MFNKIKNILCKSYFFQSKDGSLEVEIEGWVIVSMLLSPFFVVILCNATEVLL